MVKISIRRKITILVIGITLLSMLLFLFTAQNSLVNEGKKSSGAIEELKNEASKESEIGLKEQANIYLSRLVKSQADNSNYIFKTIEAQINMANDYTVELWNNQSDYISSTKDYKKLVSKTGKEELIDNPDFIFYYTLAPKISEKSVEKEVKLLSNLGTMFRSIVKNNKEMSILPLSIDGVYIGTETGIFYNMTWVAYYNPEYDARQRPWYTDAAQEGDIGWSDLYVDAARNEYIVTCYKPAYDNKGKLKGVIGTDVNINAMIDIITTQVKDIGEAFLVDQNGQVLTYSKLSGEIKEFLGNETDLNKSSNAEVKKLAKEISQNKSGIKEIYFNRVSKLVTYAPIESTNWSIVFAGSTDQIMTYVEKTKKEIGQAGTILQEYSQEGFKKTILNIVIIFIVILIISIVLLYKFSSLITKPIMELTSKVEKVGNGQLDETIDIKTGDEIEVLSSSFNKMLCDLKDYIKDLKETTAAKERIERDLQIANKIQASMLPRIFPPFPNRDDFDIFASMEPAKNVGGDYFDFFFIDENKFCITIGDVSGKGIPAALFMVIAKTLVKNEALRGLPADEIFYNANNSLCEENDEFLFVTSVIFIIDLETGEVEFANAGHNPSLLYKKETDVYKYMEINKGFVLGGMSEFKFKKESFVLKPGDVLYLYTDGVNEALDINNNQYSEPRLQKKLNSIGANDVFEIEKTIKSDVKEFVGEAEQSDDITMLVFKFIGKNK